MMTQTPVQVVTTTPPERPRGPPTQKRPLTLPQMRRRLGILFVVLLVMESVLTLCSLMTLGELGAVILGVVILPQAVSLVSLVVGLFGVYARQRWFLLAHALLNVVPFGAYFFWGGFLGYDIISNLRLTRAEDIFLVVVLLFFCCLLVIWWSFKIWGTLLAVRAFNLSPKSRAVVYETLSSNDPSVMMATSHRGPSIVQIVQTGGPAGPVPVSWTIRTPNRPSMSGSTERLPPPLNA